MADALPVWPAELPQNPFGFDDPTYTPMDNILHTQMQGGAIKSRPLFTEVPETFPIKLQLSPSQRAVLRTFLRDTLGYVMPFTWIDFRTGEAATYCYYGTALPPEQYLGQNEEGTWWQVSLTLLLLP